MGQIRQNAEAKIEIGPPSSDRALYPDKARSFNQSERALYRNFILYIYIYTVVVFCGLSCKLCPRFFRCFRLALGRLVRELTEWHIFNTHNGFNGYPGTALHLFTVYMLSPPSPMFPFHLRSVNNGKGLELHQ